MTREEIMRLEGRELDWLVHKRVFGYSTEWHEAESPSQGSGLCTYCVPLHSTDIAAAWQVVEWLTAMGYQFDLSFAPDYAPEPWLALFFVPPRGAGSVYSAYATTATEAICRAALLAVAGEASDDG